MTKRAETKVPSFAHTITERLREQEVGKTISFSPEKISSIRVLASVCSTKWDRKYYTRYNRCTKNVDVYRER